MSRLTSTIIIAFFLIGCHPLYGFIESEFTLAPESRIPRWFTIPSNYIRKDLTITITLYSNPFGIRAKVVILGPKPEHKVLAKKVGEYRSHPLTVQQDYNKYPRYFILKINGINEVFEKKQPGPILYITDDPKYRL